MRLTWSGKRHFICKMCIYLLVFRFYCHIRWWFCSIFYFSSVDAKALNPLTFNQNWIGFHAEIHSIKYCLRMKCATDINFFLWSKSQNQMLLLIQYDFDHLCLLLDVLVELRRRFRAAVFAKHDVRAEWPIKSPWVHSFIPFCRLRSSWTIFFILLQYCSILMEHFEIKITDQQIPTLMLLPFNFRFSSKNRKFSHFYFFVLIENYNLVIFFPFSFSSPNS